MRVDRANYVERLADLELELEDINWQKVSGTSEQEFSRDGLRKITEKSLLYWMKNPLIRRGVKTQANYVFGRGVTVTAVHPEVDEIVQVFMEDQKNRAVFTTIPSLVQAREGSVDHG